MGARDQFSDILSVLFIYSNIDSFFKMSFGQIYHPLTFFKNNNNIINISTYIWGVFFKSLPPDDFTAPPPDNGFFFT